MFSKRNLVKGIASCAFALATLSACKPATFGPENPDVDSALSPFYQKGSSPEEAVGKTFQVRDGNRRGSINVLKVEYYDVIYDENGNPKPGTPLPSNYEADEKVACAIYVSKDSAMGKAEWILKTLAFGKRESYCAIPERNDGNRRFRRNREVVLK